MSRAESTPPAETHRLFFALWPEQALRDAMRDAVGRQADFADRGRPVSIEKLHLTLHFLGGWPAFPEDVADAARRAAAAVEAAAFHLVVDHAGGFVRSRVGWLAPAGNSGLDALWSTLGHALDSEGVPRRDQETFAPHVTVLRHVRGSVPETALEPLSWPVADFVLIHSHGGRYEVIGRWELAAS